MDYLSPKGCMRLAEMIKAYWMDAAGLEVRCRAVRLEAAPEGKTLPNNMWMLRSNLRFNERGFPYTIDRDDF